MRYLVILALTLRAVLIPTDSYAQPTSQGVPPWPVDLSAHIHANARLRADVEAVNEFRPAYPFWQHVFLIPDGRILYGSARDGRLL